MTIRTLRIALPAAALGAAALPASAPAAPALAHGPKPCYVTVDPAAREVINLRATGFTPLDAVDLLYDGVRITSFDANADGVVRVRQPAPYQARGERPLTITLRENMDPAVAVTAFTRVTALRVDLRPKRAATSDRIRITGRGFTRQKAIWGHYVLHGRVRKTVRFAPRPATVCGTFSTRRRQIPIDRPRPGEWTLQVDQQKRWSPKPHSVFVPIPITVTRIIGG